MLWLMVHIPKTAGTSFRKAMRRVFGEALRLDYDDRPMKKRPWRRVWEAWSHGRRSAAIELPEHACIFGHYLPLKYWALARARPTRRVTWLRDPVDRLVSHYHFIFERHRRRGFGPGRNRVVDEAWPLERFLLAPMYRNWAARFLFGVPLRRFDFVGIVEDYEAELADFGRRFLGRELAAVHEKRNGERPRGEVIDPDLRRRVETFHARDVALYRKALALREARLRTPPSR